MRGGNYINPTVLGFPNQVTDGGFYGLLLDFNSEDGNGLPYFSLDFTTGIWGAEGNSGYITFTCGPNSPGGPSTMFEFNSGGFYVNGVPVVDLNGNIYVENITYILTFSSVNTGTILDENANATLSSISGYVGGLINPLPGPTVALGTGQTGTADFTLDPNATNLAFRVKLVLTVAAIASSELFIITFGTSFTFAPKIIWSGTNAGAVNLLVGTLPYPPVVDITTTGFVFAASGAMPTNTYVWDFIVIG